jgi:hypothetical protein
MNELSSYFAIEAYGENAQCASKGKKLKSESLFFGLGKRTPMVSGALARAQRCAAISYQQNDDL